MNEVYFTDTLSTTIHVITSQMTLLTTARISNPYHQHASTHIQRLTNVLQIQKKQHPTTSHPICNLCYPDVGTSCTT
jgi:hypothetical protein